MSEKAFLKHLITEDIYVLDNDRIPEETRAELTDDDNVEVIQKGNNSAEIKATSPQSLEEPEAAASSTNNEIVKEETKDEKPLQPTYKQVLIIVADTTHPKLNITDKRYIAKILQAVKVDLHSITLINILNEKVENIEGVEKILAFTPNHQLDINTVPYQLLEYQNTKMLVSDSLATVSQSIELRKKLWGVLQVMFA